MWFLLLFGILLMIYHSYRLNHSRDIIYTENEKKISNLNSPKFIGQFNQYLDLVNLKEENQRLGEFYQDMFENTTPAFAGFRYGDNPPDYF